MENNDIRWIQRFANYNKAINQLAKFIDKGKLNELEEQGLNQSFEYTHELAWNTLKDLLEYRGHKKTYGSKDATREVFKLGLIKNGETWMEMIKNKNQTSHTYNEETTKEISGAVLNRYYPEFIKLQKKFSELGKKEQNNT